MQTVTSKDQCLSWLHTYVKALSILERISTVTLKISGKVLTLSVGLADWRVLVQLTLVDVLFTVLTCVTCDEFALGADNTEDKQGNDMKKMELGEEQFALGADNTEDKQGNDMKKMELGEEQFALGADNTKDKQGNDMKRWS